MKESAGKSISAAVRARLLNLARSTGRDFQELIVRYTVERFLARLAASVHRDRFVLKGAMLYITWNLDNKRTTMDLDLLGFGNPTPENLAHIFEQICEVEIAGDGLVFDKESIEAVPIREDSIYDGVRVIVRVRLGVMPIRLQVDVGFGDVVVPNPRLAEFPALLDEHGPMVRVYSPETVIAEKFSAMVVLGMANSRMKDYFDIWMLSRNFTFEGTVLREAILQTFARRQTILSDIEPVGLSDEFSANDSKLRQWQGFVKRLRRKETPSDFSQIVAAARGLLMPVAYSISKSAPVPGVWSAPNGWGESAFTTKTPTL